MIRLTNLKLALDHSEDDLKDIILFTLKIRAEQLLDFTVFRRGIDARKKRNILLLYTHRCANDRGRGAVNNV